MRGALRCGTALLALAAGLGAQQASGSPAFMAKPPRVGAPAPFQVPARQVDQLPNGVRIVVVPDTRLPLVTVQLSVRAGASRLTPAEAGLADAEADLLTAGTPTRSALQIAEQLDAMGANLSASADPDFLTVHASVLSTQVRPLMELLSDVVLHPTFPESEVKLEQANMLAALEANRADAGFLASVTFHQALFGAHPYAITAPTPESIARITRSALVAFHDKYFLPNNQAVVVIVGDIAPARAHNLAQQYFGDWRLGSPLPPPSPPVTNPPSDAVYLVERPGSAQSTLVLGNLGTTRTAADYFAFRVANEVLGGSFNSRLMTELREARGYTYGIYSANAPYRDLGAWMISTEVRTAVTAPALTEILDQLRRIRSAPLSAQEMVQAKNYLSGTFLLGLQTQGALAGAMALPDLYGVPRDWLANFTDHIRSVSASDAEAAAKTIIQPGHLVIVIVGDARQIEAPLATALPNTTMKILNAAGQTIGSYPPASAAGAAQQLY